MALTSCKNGIVLQDHKSRSFVEGPSPDRPTNRLPPTNVSILSDIYWRYTQSLVWNGCIKERTPQGNFVVFQNFWEKPLIYDDKNCISNVIFSGRNVPSGTIVSLSNRHAAVSSAFPVLLLHGLDQLHSPSALRRYQLQFILSPTRTAVPHPAW